MPKLSDFSHRLPLHPSEFRTAYGLALHFTQEVPEEYVCTMCACAVLSCRHDFGAAGIEVCISIAAAYDIGVPDLSGAFSM